VIDFLRGSKNEKIREDHKELKTYGVGKDISKADWQRYLRELVALGYLQFTQTEYPVLQLTPKSHVVLKGEEKVELIATQIIEERQTEDLPFENDLLSILKNTRRNMAELENVPAYVIVSDATLMEMATYLPQSLEELRFISGFGDIKLARYGREFVNRIQTYTAERGLNSKIAQKSRKRERKPRAEKSSVPRSSDTRRASLEMYKKDKTIAEIAAERGLSVSTVESHLSHFVQSGELDVLEMVPSDKIPAIQEAIEGYGADRLAPLKEVLGPDFSYGEIKAVLGWMNRNE
jgi:ATP-dependent DNA helicase RecQ